MTASPQPASMGDPAGSPVATKASPMATKASTIATKALWDSRRSLLGWAIGIVAAAAVYTGSYAAVDPDAYADVLEAWPTELVEAFGWDDIATPAGYLGSTVYGLIMPVLLAVFAIGSGARHLAGDEESGTMELIAAHPVSRRSLLLQRAAAVVAMAGVLAALLLLTVVALGGPVGIDVSIGRLVAATLQLWLLTVVLAMVTIAGGAISGRRGVAIAAGATVAAASYAAGTVVPTVGGLGWVERLSVFHYYDAAGALRDGSSPSGIAVLVVVSAVLLAVALVVFDRRDLLRH